MPLAAIWMDLEIVMLNEVSQKKKDKYHMGSIICKIGGSQEELPHVRGQGRWPRGDTQCLRSGAATRGVTPCPRSGAAAGRSNPTPKARGSGREDQPHAMAARAQEGLEELSHVEGQEGRQ